MTIQTVSHRTSVRLEIAGGIDYRIHALNGVTFRLGNLWVSLTDRESALSLAVAWRNLTTCAARVDWTNKAATLIAPTSEIATYLQLSGLQPVPVPTAKKADACLLKQGEVTGTLGSVKITCLDRIDLSTLDSCWSDTYTAAQLTWLLPTVKQIDERIRRQPLHRRISANR